MVWYRFLEEQKRQQFKFNTTVKVNLQKDTYKKELNFELAKVHERKKEKKLLQLIMNFMKIN